MFGQLFRNSPLLVYPIAALAIFLAVFTVIVLRVYGRKASTYDGVSRLPLESEEDDTNTEARRHV